MNCIGCDKAKEAAVKTLEKKGYVYKGGELWMPPLGDPPDFDLIDEIDEHIERLERVPDYDRFTEYHLLKKVREGLMSRRKVNDKWIFIGISGNYKNNIYKCPKCKSTLSTYKISFSTECNNCHKILSYP